MITFKIDGKEYSLPEVINIDHYTKIFKIKDLLSDDYFAAKLVSIVSGAPIEGIMEGEYEQINYMASYILELLPKDTPQFKDRFIIDGVKYGFFPNWKDMTYAEFVDMDTISTRPPDEMLNMLHILAAVMYRPIINERSEHDFDIEKYDVKTMVKRAELFKNKLDVRYVLGAQTFFTQLEKRFLAYTRLSSIPKLSIWMKIKLVWKWRKVMLKVIFKKRLGGISSRTELLETILQSMITSTIKR
jgi:hypothetical protein